MFIGNALSSTAVNDSLLTPRATALHDYEYGGIALQQPSHGLDYQLWQVVYESNEVRVFAPSVAKTALFTRAGITELSLAFDQNMRPVVVYVADGITYIYWYDPTIAQQTTTELGVLTNPRISLDDHREGQLFNSDVILGYLNDGYLCIRLQRDRYTIEYQLTSLMNAQLNQVGMGRNNRFNFIYSYHYRGEGSVPGMGWGENWGLSWSN